MAGAKGVSTTGGLAMQSELTEVARNARYTEVFRAPLVTLTASHDIDAGAGGTRVIHGIEVSGPAAWMLYVFKRGELQQGMNDAIRRLTTRTMNGLPTSWIP